MKEKEIAENILKQIDEINPTFLDIIYSSSYMTIPQQYKNIKLKTPIKNIEFELKKNHIGGVLFSAVYLHNFFVVCITLNDLDLYDITIHNILTEKTETVENVVASKLVDHIVEKLEKSQLYQSVVEKEATA